MTHWGSAPVTILFPQLFAHYVAGAYTESLQKRSMRAEVAIRGHFVCLKQSGVLLV